MRGWNRVWARGGGSGGSGWNGGRCVLGRGGDGGPGGIYIYLKKLRSIGICGEFIQIAIA